MQLLSIQFWVFEGGKGFVGGEGEGCTPEYAALHSKANIGEIIGELSGVLQMSRLLGTPHEKI
jgi:hypothetical protein